MNLRKILEIGRNRKLLVAVVVVVLLLSTYTAYSIYIDANQATKAQKSGKDKSKSSSESKSKPKSKSSSKKAKPKPRKFAIQIINVEESGMLSRIVTAKLINKDGYAKNLKVKLELFLDRERIKVNGEDALVIALGDMEANSSVEKEVEISVGFFDGLKIKSKGYVYAKLTITWENEGKSSREVYRKRIKI